MLSRFLLNGSLNLKKSSLKFLQPAFITTSAKVACGKKNEYPPEYPPPTSKRDFVNFPKMVRRETPPPVRLFFLPESWFTFMYPKTGYTGPYMLVFGLATYFGMNETFTCVEAFYVTAGILTIIVTVPKTKLGKFFGEAYNKILQKEIDEINNSQDSEIKALQSNIASYKGFTNMKSAVQEVGNAKIEIIKLQLENAYRERITALYEQVKRKLDCQAELESLEKQLFLKNLQDYVMRNVLSSITPELEKSVLQQCISDLNSLAARA